VNIKPMLVRLESAMGRDNLVEQMILLPGSETRISQGVEYPKIVNLIVGYNSSPKSQTALDLTLCIAHQTRLATNAQVIVQVVYVVDDNQSSQCPDVFSAATTSRASTYQLPLELAEASASKPATPVFTQARPQAIAASPQIKLLDPIEQAEHIFWQARSLSAEWQDCFNAHLRFGCIATELKKVVESETATLLLLGCTSVNHPIIQQLGANFPCPVLGIPNYED
jgi:hypothetical protein